jgi:PA14 domain
MEGIVRRFLVISLTAGAVLGFGYSNARGQEPVPLLTRPVQERPESEAPSFTFKAITRMVIVGVVARDAEDNPVRDLTAKDLLVSETIDGAKPVPQTIASFLPMDGAVASSRAASKGIVLSWLRKSFCPLSGAYELSYYLSSESRKDGLHRILVTSPRRGLKLYFRPGYRIEADKPAGVAAGEFASKETSAQMKKQQLLEEERRKHPELAVAVAACYDTLDTTFPLHVDKIKSKKGDAFEFVVPGSYFASLPVSERGQPRPFDFSLCTFAYGGQPIQHFEGTVQAGSSPDDYAVLSSRGFAHTLVFESLQPDFELQSPPRDVRPPALSARLVLRDRQTGALGSGEILLLPLSRDIVFSAPIPEGQTNESFGSLTRDNPLAMCGDVYQLAPWTTNLPRFSEIDAIAPIYANSVGVYSRFFTRGIPGITSRTEWFGVNYQGAFGIDKAGKYEFDLISDDGAKVYIDDKLVVSDDTIHPAQRSRSKVQLGTGAHDIRISYFQGPRTEIALVLLVKPPGRAWRLFDTRDFPPPDAPSSERKNLPLPGE